MRLATWTLMAATGCLAASAYAGDDNDRPAEHPQGVRVLVRQGAPGEVQRVIAVREGEDAPPAPPAPVAPAAPRDRAVQQELERARAEVGRFRNIRRAESVKGAYLGVNTTPPAPVLRKQLGLPQGTGLVVQFVVPDSPAAKAGLKEFDVLQKLDDQLLINAEQLAVLVRIHAPGDEIKIGIIRDGKPQALVAKLAEHELEPLAEWLDGEPRTEDVLRFMPEPRLQEVRPENVVPPFDKIPHMKEFFHAPIVSSFTWIDGDKTYTVTTFSNGRRTLSAKDKEGSILFDGPINTPEQRDKLPDDMKKQLEHMQKRFPAGNAGFDFGNGAANDESSKTKPVSPSKDPRDAEKQ
jgi:membrane-associated protease RseP (regulator of RpoE activity)